MAYTIDQHRLSSGFVFGFTRTGWLLAGLYGAIWLLAFVANTLGLGGTVDLLLLHSPFNTSDLGPGFAFWQIFTAPLVFAPWNFGAYVIGLLGLGFFASYAEGELGTRSMLRLWAIAALGGVLGAILFSLLPPGQPVVSGFSPSLWALMFLFCLSSPQAQVTFFISVPVRLLWLGYGILAFVFLRAFTGAGGYELGGLAAAWLWWRYGEQLDFGGRLRERKARRVVRQVLDEAYNDIKKDDDGPVYH